MFSAQFSRKKNRSHSSNENKEIKADRVVRIHEETIEPSNELPIFEETENKTHVISLKTLDKRCSNIEMQFSKILAKLDVLEKCMKSE